jgi:hypothetical protein
MPDRQFVCPADIYYSPQGSVNHDSWRMVSRHVVNILLNICEWISTQRHKISPHISAERRLVMHTSVPCIFSFSKYRK